MESDFSLNLWLHMFWKNVSGATLRGGSSLGGGGGKSGYSNAEFKMIV